MLRQDNHALTINDDNDAGLLEREPVQENQKKSLDLHTLFAFFAEMFAGAGDILYLSRFLSYLNQDPVFAGLSPIGIALGTLIAVGASVGTAKSHYELNKYFDGSEKNQNEKKPLSHRQKIELLLNMIAYGINVASPIGSALRKAEYDFGLTLQESSIFAINTSLLTMGSVFGLGDTVACKNAMTHKKMQPQENKKKIDKLSLFSAVGRIPGLVSYFYFGFVFFKLWADVCLGSSKDKEASTALTYILPATLGGAIALFATAGTVYSRYKLYDYCANELGVEQNANRIESKKLSRAEKAALLGSAAADTCDIASSLVFNVEVLAMFVMNAKQNPLSPLVEIFGLFLPALLIGAEGAAANYRTTKIAMQHSDKENVITTIIQNTFYGSVDETTSVASTPTTTGAQFFSATSSPRPEGEFPPCTVLMPS